MQVHPRLSERDMKTSRLTLIALAFPVALAAQQQQSADPAAGPITNAFRARFANLYRLLPQAFDSIPADKFGYKPTPAQQTIGYVAQHLANDNYFFCNAFGDKKATRPEEETATPDSVKATWPKDKLVASLKASIAFCQEAFSQLNDARLADEFDVQARTRDGGTTTIKVARVTRVLGHAMDMQDHYAQIANYMRLNGMLPPSALPRPRPSGN